MKQPLTARILRALLRFFFTHFYHTFAWSYDLVAAVVSLGRWNQWVRSVLPFIEGRRVLEIGHGPGHLQQYMRAEAQRFCVGLDESPQMGRLARRLLIASGFPHVNLARALAQSLPFPDAAFDTIVSTFPAEYIFEHSALSEALRALRAGGRLIVLPAAWISGRHALDRSAAWLFRVTQQAPADPYQIVSDKLRRPFEDAGFRCDFKTVEVRSSLVLIVIATRDK